MNSFSHWRSMVAVRFRRACRRVCGPCGRRRRDALRVRRRREQTVTQVPQPTKSTFSCVLVRPTSSLMGLGLATIMKFLHFLNAVGSLPCGRGTGLRLQGLGPRLADELTVSWTRATKVGAMAERLVMVRRGHQGRCRRGCAGGARRACGRGDCLPGSGSRPRGSRR